MAFFRADPEHPVHPGAPSGPGSHQGRRTASSPAVERIERADRWLAAAAVLFTVAVLLHNGDHLRRGPGSTASDVVAAGTSSVLLEVAVVVLVVVGHRLAPLVAVAAGWGLAVGYVLVHLLSARSWLSDPLFDGGASPLSQVAALLEIVAAVVLAVTGQRSLRARGGLASAAAGPPSARRPSVFASRASAVAWRTAWTSPVVLVMAVGNAVILIGTFARG